ncbi:hypothetical protein [Bacillus wiedmannii]|uniref:hypothetical protein n=1 Tax=Bacillus wiedmannii TaxID=1890302 RepID=UPI001E343638|nr:hypothetical protein [Bacillus wiedmannii]MCC2424615.1 hypothetical protein [Bacillus wiedmannii]
MKWPIDSSHCSWIPLKKAKVARSECEVDGASDLEAFFASWEEAKPPNILATIAGFQQKAKVARSQATNKKEKAPLFIKAKPLFSYLRFFFFFLNPGTFSKKPFFFLPLPLPSFFPG